MTSERIKEIQEQTAYPESVSVKQALLQVWKECEQEQSRTTDINEQSKKIANFCACKKPWGVRGRCVACETPIKIG